MKMYHATDEQSARSIIQDGKIKTRFGEILLTDSVNNALKFLLFRGLDKVIIFEVDVDESKMLESFDHSEAFFGCKAWMVFEDIPVSSDTVIYEQDMQALYDLMNEKGDHKSDTVVEVGSDVINEVADAVSATATS